MSTLIFSIGHSDRDPGAVASGTTEHLEVKNIVSRATTQLLDLGYSVWVIPTNLSLIQKINWVNQNARPDDFLIAVHLNAVSNSSATGTETWYLLGSDRGKSFARVLQSELVKVLALRDRGVKGDRSNQDGRLGIIRDTKVPAWLLELGFVSNPTDLNAVRERGPKALFDAARQVFTANNPYLEPGNLRPFSDVKPESWYFDLVKEAKAQKIIAGFDDGTFRPNQPISRAELLQVLKNLGLF
jgi:N-acetylmuramoyl-L-alanine amidase